MAKIDKTQKKLLRFTEVMRDMYAKVAGIEDSEERECAEALLDNFRVYFLRGLKKNDWSDDYWSAVVEIIEELFNDMSKKGEFYDDSGELFYCPPNMFCNFYEFLDRLHRYHAIRIAEDEEIFS